MAVISSDEQFAAIEAKLKMRNELVAKNKQTSFREMGSQKYLEDPDVQKFNKTLREEGFKRARRSVKMGSPEEADKSIQDYFNLCDECNQLPSLKSLSMYMGVSIYTFNKYANDPDSEYHDILCAALDYIHSVIEGGAMLNKVNPSVYMYTAANYYGMKDTRSIEINQNIAVGNTGASTRESLAALREQILLEQKQERDAQAKDAILVEPKALDYKG